MPGWDPAPGAFDVTVLDDGSPLVAAELKLDDIGQVLWEIFKVSSAHAAPGVLGTPVHVGAVGAGTAAKLVANSTLFGVLAVLGEALALAEQLGLPRGAAFEVLAATPLAAQAERRRSWIESDGYPTRFSLSLALKDADLIREAAAASGCELPVGEAARQWLAEAEAAGLGDEDYSAVLAQILGSRATGGVRPRGSSPGTLPAGVVRPRAAGRRA